MSLPLVQQNQCHSLQEQYQPQELVQRRVEPMERSGLEPHDHLRPPYPSPDSLEQERMLDDFPILFQDVRSALTKTQRLSAVHDEPIERGLLPTQPVNQERCAYRSLISPNPQ